MSNYCTKKEQNHGKNPAKLIFCIIFFLIVGIVIITHEIEPITASEKAVIIFSFVLTAFFMIGTGMPLKEWLENQTDKKGITLLKKVLQNYGF